MLRVVLLVALIAFSMFFSVVDLGACFFLRVIEIFALWVILRYEMKLRQPLLRKMHGPLDTYFTNKIIQINKMIITLH